MGELPPVIVNPSRTVSKSSEAAITTTLSEVPPPSIVVVAHELIGSVLCTVMLLPKKVMFIKIRKKRHFLIHPASYNDLEQRN